MTTQTRSREVTVESGSKHYIPVLYQGRLLAVMSVVGGAGPRYRDALRLPMACGI